MRTILVSFVVLVLSSNSFVLGQEKDKEKKEAKPKKVVYTDPDQAPIDYKIQGEYGSALVKGFAFQVVARGNNKFDVYVLEAGLPGAGWDPKSKKMKIEANLDPDKGVATFSYADWKGTIDPAKGTLEAKNGTNEFSLARIERKSPTIGAKPPDGAIVLFDGKNADEWNEKKMVGDLLGVPNTTKKTFNSFKLHIEFRTPFQPNAGGQGRGNSGIYLQGRHEIQVLDSFGLKGASNECGALYGFRAPTVNMCLPPLVWQTFDIEYHTGKIDAATKKQEGPTVTLFHNGIKIHDNVGIKGSSTAGPIHLQNHGDPVVYRNVWIVELK